jgi:hypothetical protein
VFCNATTCGDHGHCSNSTGLCQCDENYFGPSCVCLDGYFGVGCQQYCVANSTCNNRGYCDEDGSCVCTDSAYFGGQCDVNKLGLGLGLGLSGLAVAGTIVTVVACKKRKNRGYEPIQD